MSRKQTHVNILLSRIASHGDEAFFKAIHKNASGLTLDVTTYAKFGRDIGALSTQLKSDLTRDGVKDGAVVGLWLHGLTYSDAVHLCALCKAGYVPNTLSPSLTDPTVILELLARTGAQALLHGPQFSLGKADCKIPTYTTTDVNTLGSISEQPAFPVAKYDPERLAFIQYTSGSTGDMPKAVPCTNRWLESVYNSWESVWNPAEKGSSQDVFNIPGSFTNPSGLHVLLMAINFGAAVVQSTTLFFSSKEFLQVTSQCGLNRLNMFAPVLSLYIKAAQQQLKTSDDTLFKVLLNMRSIVYGGLPMLPALENWAFENKLPIMNALGTTEAGPLLRCNLGEHPQRLRPFPSLAIEFVPVEGGLFKMAVLDQSPNFPDASLLNPDGKFYTGDLFAQVEDGIWSHRGRDGDWIKLASAKLVNMKIIEDFIRQHCSDIITELVVVGSNRPSPVLLAEPVEATSGQPAKGTILERMAPFDQRRFTWERLTADTIVFVGKDTLPRTATKGNVRRKAAEIMFEKELDAALA